VREFELHIADRRDIGALANAEEQPSALPPAPCVKATMSDVGPPVPYRDRVIPIGESVTAGTVVGLVATGHTREEILELYPYLEEEDIRQALSYAAWRAEGVEVPLASA
jgi:hypothetical protein